MVADSIYQSLTSQENGTYAFALTALDAGNKNEVTSSVNFSNTSFDGYYYTLKNGPSAILDFVGNLIEMLSSGFLYLGIGLAVFASLMMFNFITISINHKKREIGILRAVGAKSSDVFGIFFNESMIIAIINFVLSATATVIVSIALSNFFRDYLPITILSFGLRQLLLMFGISVLVAFVSSFLPVMRISRKRPIDAIQNR